MKKAFLYLLGIVLMATSCLDIADVYQRLDTLEQKVAGLEGLNGTVQGLSNSISALEGKVYVKEVVETDEGYVIKFTNDTQAVIRDGVDGEDGEDGATPTIGVKEEGGELVWTVNGQVVKDESGKAVPATVKVPEFKFDNNKWWYRFGPTDSWKDCGEKTGPEPTMVETEDAVIITIGDTTIAIPKEVISPSIETIKVLPTPNRLFVPTGKTLDLKEWFEIGPEGAMKSTVKYQLASVADGIVNYFYDIPEDAPISISPNGIVTSTGRGSYTVYLLKKGQEAEKGNPTGNYSSIVIRTAPTPANEEPVPAANPSEKFYIFKGSLEEVPGLAGGGSVTLNPFNNDIAALVGPGGAGHNVYLRPNITTTGVTLENGHLHFMYYISDVTKLKPGAGQVELNSVASADNAEKNWTTDFLADCHNGWNEVTLDFNKGDFTDGNSGRFDPATIKWFRFYNETTVPSTADYEAIQVKDIYVYADYSAVESVAPKGNSARGVQLFVPVGQTIDLKDYYTVSPAGATRTDVTYTVSDTEALSVDENGIAKGLSRGNLNVVIKPKAKPDDEGIKMIIRTDVVPEFDEPAMKSEEVIFHTCDNTEFFTKGPGDNRKVEIATTDPKEGSGWYKSTTTKQAELAVISRASSPIDAKMTSPHRGHVSFWFYVENRADGNNAAKLSGRVNGGRIEVSNDGGNKGIYWETKDVFKDLKDGWNLIDLKFRDAKGYGDENYVINPAKISWFRIYMNGPAALYDEYTWGIDKIAFYEDYEETTAEKKYLLHPTFEEFQNMTIGGACNWYPDEPAFAAWVSRGGAANQLNFYFKPVDVNSGATIQNGHLHFKWFISDIAALAGSTAGQVELGSGGAADAKELTLSNSFIAYCHSGWNDITLDFKRNVGAAGDFDPALINWFRFYESALGGNLVSMIKDVYVYAE